MLISVLGAFDLGCFGGKKTCYEEVKEGLCGEEGHKPKPKTNQSGANEQQLREEGWIRSVNNAGEVSPTLSLPYQIA